MIGVALDGHRPMRGDDYGHPGLSFEASFLSPRIGEFHTTRAVGDDGARSQRYVAAIKAKLPSVWKPLLDARGALGERPEGREIVVSHVVRHIGFSIPQPYSLLFFDYKGVAD